MNFTKKHYVLAEGLHSGALRENILKWLSKCQYEIPQQTFDKTEVKSFTTLSGDVHTSSQHDLTAKDTYIIQEIGDDPWQDLASICISAQALMSRNARSVTAIVPVWKLGWHGKGGLKNPNVTGSHQLTAGMLATSGVDRLVTLTPLPDMFSPLYPVKVEVPDISQHLIERFRCNRPTDMMIIVDEPDAVPYAEMLGHITGLPVVQCSQLKDWSYLIPDIHAYDVLLFTNRFSSRLLGIARPIAEHGSRIVCYAPRIERPEELSESVFQYIESFITLDPAYHEPFQVLPVGQIMAEWIIKDRIEKT